MRTSAIFLAVAVLATACTAEPTPFSAPTGQPAASSSTGQAAAVCKPEVHNEPLPVWARGGFSGDARAIYSLGRSGQIVAVLFGYPLSQPPAEGRNNKILWVASPASKGAANADPNLIIEARLDGKGDPVQRRVDGGPGPSIVDLPEPGCWRLSLSWGGRTDTIDLEYNAP
jgi:hypothetical protein